MRLHYWVLEFTNDRSQVFYDWERAASADNAAKAKEKEYGGVVYWVEGPFMSESEATAYLKEIGHD